MASAQKSFFMEEKVRNHHKILWGLLLSFCVSNTFSPSKAEAAAPLKDWNMLVFLSGVNNLDEYGAMNINQMEEVGSNDRMNILVQWGSLERPTVDRLLIQKDSNTEAVTSPVVASRGNADMGDWNELVDFARWANENYPAKKTFVVVWNHGSGWHKMMMNPQNVQKDISWDERTGNFITTEQLGQAMDQIARINGKKVELYGSDACLMGMVEVADEMSDSVDVFVGSQDLEPGQGWPYTHFLQSWVANMDRTPAEVGVLLSKEFLAAYSGGVYGNREVTMSVFDLAKMGNYREAVARLTQELTQLPRATLKNLNQAAKATKYFFDNDYRDMIDFLNQSARKKVTLTNAADVRQAHSEFVIANDQNQDANTFGLSIWLPIDTSTYNRYKARYNGLSFNQKTNWMAFLDKMVNAR